MNCALINERVWAYARITPPQVCDIMIGEWGSWATVSLADPLLQALGDWSCFSGLCQHHDSMQVKRISKH